MRRAPESAFWRAGGWAAWISISVELGPSACRWGDAGGQGSIFSLESSPSCGCKSTADAKTGGAPGLSQGRQACRASPPGTEAAVPLCLACPSPACRLTRGPGEGPGRLADKYFRPQDRSYSQSLGPLGGLPVPLALGWGPIPCPTGHTSLMTMAHPGQSLLPTPGHPVKSRPPAGPGQPGLNPGAGCVCVGGWL